MRDVITVLGSRYIGVNRFPAIPYIDMIAFGLGTAYDP